jgi:hypothetical protein
MGKIEEVCCDIARLTLASYACMESSKKLLCHHDFDMVPQPMMPLTTKPQAQLPWYLTSHPLVKR